MLGILVTIFPFVSPDCLYLHFLFSLIIDSSRKAKIGNFELHVVIEQHISQLEISVDDIAVMYMLDTTDELTHIVPHLWFRQGLSVFQHVYQRLKIDRKKCTR